MKYWFIMGTAAELIKMFPVLDEAIKSQKNWFLWSTGQGSTNFWTQAEDFSLPKECSFSLDAKAVDLSSSVQALRWFLRNIFRSARSISETIREKTGETPESGDYAIVHGDTLSTLLGAIQARRLGCKVIHVEAGLRTGSIFSPFPEEINRRIVSRLAHIHFAPDEKAASHLRQEKQTGEIIVTGGNSVFDSLTATLKTPRPNDLPQGKYIVANLHRFENLASSSRWETLITTAIQAAKIHPVYFVMHPPTEAKLDRDGEAKKRLQEAGVHLWGRLAYSRFMHLMAGASFVITDGGSNQSECGYLGIPCLIMRSKTEVQEGLGANCILSGFEDAKIQDFFSRAERLRVPAIELKKSPSKIIWAKIRPIE